MTSREPGPAAALTGPCLWASFDGMNITKRGGSGWSRMHPTLPRLSTWMTFVVRLGGPSTDAVDDWDVEEEVMVEIRVKGGVCAFA
jgi:hypothetical protein